MKGVPEQTQVKNRWGVKFGRKIWSPCEDLNLAADVLFCFFPRPQVFWWLIEGKFGNRDEALAPRLLTIVDDAASACTSDVGLTTPCFNAPWEMETPGWSLDLGITAVSCWLSFFPSFLLFLVLHFPLLPLFQDGPEI